MLEQTLFTLPEKAKIIQFIFVKMRNTTNFQQEILINQNVKRALLKYYFVIYLQKVVVPPLLVQIPRRANFQCVYPNIFRHGLKLSSNLCSMCYAQNLIPTEKKFYYLGNQSKNAEKRMSRRSNRSSKQSPYMKTTE